MLFDTIWEYIVNLIELMLFVVFIHTKLHIKNEWKHRSLEMVLFVIVEFAILCCMNTMRVSSYITLISSCMLDIVYTGVFYRDRIVLRLFWGFSYSIICLVAEQITFFIPTVFCKDSSLELLLGGELRKPYTMLYLTLIAVLVLLLYYITDNHIALSFFQKTAYIFIAISGLAIGHYNLKLTLEFMDQYGDPSFSAKLSLVNLFFLVLFLALLLYIYQLGHSKEENLDLLKKQRIYELERVEFNSLAETTEHLRALKHDMQIHLDAISILAKEKKWDELISYTEQYQNNLSQAYSMITTGNTAIDSILTAKLNDAKKRGIKTTYSIIAPEIFPLNPIELSSVLGNIWNNAIEAGKKLLETEPEEQPYIYFYMKPYQNMILIHIENNFDGIIKGKTDGEILSTKKEKGHGLGIRRVKGIVENAGGMMQITAENRVFSVHIMIPEKETTHENENNNA